MCFYLCNQSFYINLENFSMEACKGHIIRYLRNYWNIEDKKIRCHVPLFV